MVTAPLGMDSQALSVLDQLSFDSDPRTQEKLLEYFEMLKMTDEGWKLSVTAFTSGKYNSDNARYFFLQVLEAYLKSRYVRASTEDHEQVRSFLLTCLQMQSAVPTKDKNFLKNKIAQLFSLVFVVDFPHRWPSFFMDILNSTSLGPLAVEMFLRVLKAIDSEVVDREIVHTNAEAERNSLLKDAMREQVVPQLVDSWYQIMTTYQCSDPEIVCMCLSVVGQYISWIDINLVANELFVTVLLTFLNMPLLRECSCDCIHEIICKGMDPVAKTKLVESFASILNNAGVMCPAEDEEGDYLAKLAKLINGMGISLIHCYQKLVKSGDLVNAAVTLQSLENKLPLMSRFLGHDDDDISEAVAGFAQDYIMLLKQLQNLTQSHQKSIENILYIIVKKMKYDDSYNFSQEGEEEAMFQDYRKQVKVIFNNLAQLDSDLIVVAVHNIVATTLPQWKTVDFQDVELAITLMYMLGEAVPTTQGQLFSGDETKVSPLQQMMRLLVSTSVSRSSHMIVQLQYFETVVRYEKFFSCQPEYIPDVLMSFLDERGFRNQSPQIRSRTAYLFSRFIKCLKSHLHNYLEDILKRMQDLLTLQFLENGCQQLLSNEDQLFIYETAGTLIVSSNFPPERKQLLMQQLLAPIVTKFEALLTLICTETDEDQQLVYAKTIYNAMGFASRTSKGFSSQQTMKQCGCVAAFTETLKIFLQAFKTPVQRSVIRSGVRQYLHRMVVCLEEEILPFIPIALDNLLQEPDARELHDFIPLMTQLIMKFKKTITHFLQEAFMPFVSTVYRVLSFPSDELDQVTASEKQMLQRSYFQFLACIVSNNVLEVLSNQDAQSLREVLLTVVEGACDNPDPQTQKICFNILKRLIDAWGGKDGLVGFEEFIYKNVVPACVLAPLKPTFDLSDGQTMLALGESSLCLKCMLDKRGKEAIDFLQNEYLPTLNFSPELIRQYCHALVMDVKSFKNFLKTFYADLKS